MCEGDPVMLVPTWEVIVMLRRCQHHLEVFMDEALDGMSMTFAQYRALEALITVGPMHISYLGRRLHVSRQAAQQSARKLALLDLIDLKPEGRELVARPTDMGRRRLMRCQQATRPLRSGLERALAPTRLATLHTLLVDAESGLRPPPPRVRPWWLD
jgi:DNA-binding MarR family transcriptional regulator